MIQVTDHEDAGKALLVTQYRGKANLEAYLGAFLAQVQIVEDVLFDIFVILDLSVQVGEQLDLIGRLVGQPRNGVSDADYRPRIQARLLINRSSGISDDILALAALLTTATREILPQYPAALALRLNGEVNVGVELAGLLKSLVSAGVRALLEWCSEPVAFGFDASDRGFDDADAAWGTAL